MTSNSTVVRLEQRTARRWPLIWLSGLAGLLLAIAWSPELVDKVIATDIAKPVLGDNPANVIISGSAMAIGFAFISGVAGMFTACNVAVFSALAPLSAQDQSKRNKAATLLRPIGWLMLGAVAVAGSYGAIGVLFHDWMPQLSDARMGDPKTGLQVRIVQAGIVFGAIGLIMLWRGLAYAGVAKNPLAGLYERRPRAELVFLGGLMGAFLIGRPYPPFRKLYEYAASTHNPLLGFLTFSLQSVGNIFGVSLLFVVITLLTRGRFQRWLLNGNGRADRFSAVSFIIVGTFFFFYWTVKLGARAGLFWWPKMPWNS